MVTSVFLIYRMFRMDGIFDIFLVTDSTFSFATALIGNPETFYI